MNIYHLHINPSLKSSYPRFSTAEPGRYAGGRLQPGKNSTAVGSRASGAREVTASREEGI